MSRLNVVGTVEPGKSYNISAPFDGTVKERLVEYGSRVSKGTLLLVMDTGDIDVRVREAEVAVLRASRTLDEMRDWANSPEVSRARRGVAAAKSALKESRRKAAETRLLLDRGIVPRLEWEALEQQTKTLAMQLEAADQDLKSATDKGSQANRRIAELELANARDRLRELQGHLDRFAIMAPVAGLVLRPPPSMSGPSASPGIETGDRVSRGHPLFVVAERDRLVVAAKVDEIDVNRLHEGQVVDVNGKAFGTAPLEGRIKHVSVQASPSTTGRESSFDIKIEISSTEE